MSRTSRLLIEAAKWLDDMRDPFSHAFLSENEVTSSECFDLSEQVALAIRLYVAAKKNPALLVALVANEEDPEIANAVMHVAAMTDTIERLKALGT